MLSILKNLHILYQMQLSVPISSKPATSWREVPQHADREPGKGLQSRDTASYYF